MYIAVHKLRKLLKNVLNLYNIKYLKLNYYKINIIKEKNEYLCINSNKNKTVFLYYCIVHSN